MLLLVSCQHSTFTRKPIDSNAHTLYFEFLKSGEYVSALGTHSAVINGGEPRALKVIIPKGARGQLMITDDGDEIISYPVDGEESLEVHLGAMPEYTKTSTIGLAMATKNYGVLTGRLYLIGNLTVNESMMVDFECPYRTNIGAVATCIRPEQFNFFLNVTVEDDYSGKMKVSTRGVCTSDTDIIEVGKGKYTVKIQNDEPGYCHVRVDLRQDREDGEWNIKKFKEVNISYYHRDYTPLAKPSVSGKPGKWKIKFNDMYKSLYLNGKYRTAKKKRTVRDEKLFFVIWDKYGRADYVRK